MFKKVKKEKKKTALFTWFILGWFIMFILGLFVFSFKYPNLDLSGPEYQSFFWLWFKLYLELFAFGYLLKHDLVGKILNKVQQIYGKQE